ncbi:MAG TPA: ABC transporter ATP-binding protein [Bryobacteraceae bacterium]|nr:ABC transporter ATP-binding protein [Bryobacteraceae bacterium]
MIHIRELRKSFGAHTALDRVSIEVRRGDCFALLGPNGSGKTTLLKCLAGLVHPSSGDIRIDGVDVVSAGARTRSGISYLPQHAGFPEHLRVREVLEFYRRLRGLPARRVGEVIEILGCRSFADRFVNELSGGMRQRLAIAVVCLPASPVLLLDEPTASLDPESAAGFRDLLARLKKEGRTIVFATHVLADVEVLADRVAILVGGKLLAVETVDDLRREASPRGLRVRLERSGPQHARAARAAGAASVRVEGRVLDIACAPDRTLPVLRALELSGARIESFSSADVTLDEIYLRYMHAEGVATDAAGDSCGVPVGAAEAC